MCVCVCVEDGSKKEASKVKQTTKQSNTTHPRQTHAKKMSCFGWESNPQHSRLIYMYVCFMGGWHINIQCTLIIIPSPMNFRRRIDLLFSPFQPNTESESYIERDSQKAKDKERENERENKLQRERERERERESEIYDLLSFSF